MIIQTGFFPNQSIGLPVSPVARAADLSVKPTFKVELQVTPTHTVKTKQLPER